MNKKLSKKIKYRQMLASKDKLELTRVVIVSKNTLAMDKLKATCIGDVHKPGKYGNGPLAYEGIQNKSESIFMGQSKLDPERKLAVFKNKGLTQFDSLINNDNRKTEMEGIFMSKANCECHMNIPASLQADALTPDVTTNYLRLASQELTQQAGTRKVRVAFNEKKKQLEIGSATSRRLLVTIEQLQEGTSLTTLVVIEGDFSDAQARNILEASKLSPSGSLKLAIAASILDLVSPLKNHELINNLRNICSSYEVEDVLLSKRERNKLGKNALNSKVTYLKNGLRSCLKNLPMVEPDAQAQYAAEFGVFTAELAELARTLSPAVDIVNAIKVALGYKPSTTVSKSSKEESDSYKS